MRAEPAHVDPFIAEEPSDESAVPVVPDRRDDRYGHPQPRQAGRHVAGKPPDEALEGAHLFEWCVDLERIQVRAQAANDERIDRACVLTLVRPRD